MKALAILALGAGLAAPLAVPAGLVPAGGSTAHVAGPSTRLAGAGSRRGDSRCADVPTRRGFVRVCRD